MNWPDVSIIIYSNGDPDGCVRLLTDCERLDRSGVNVETILVLQGLTAKVEQMLRDYKFSFEIKFIRAETDMNRAAGRNLGAAAATHDILLFLDSDLEVSPELIKRHLEVYKSEKVAAVMGEIYLPEFIKKSRWYRFLDSTYRSARRWSARAHTQYSPPLRYVKTANFSVRRAVYEACGGHNESIGHHEAEDIDLAYRINSVKMGAIRFQPEAVAFCQYPPLKQALQDKLAFGLNGIPRLLEIYPDLYPVLPSRFVRLEGFPKPGPARTFLKVFLFNYPVTLVARVMRLLGPEVLAFRMMRFLLQYESIRGVKQAFRK